jgi:hypothetical protein
MAKCFEATYTVLNSHGNKGDTKTQLVGGNSLKHAAAKADAKVGEAGYGELIKIELKEEVIL